jgi:hypothetical protein
MIYEQLQRSFAAMKMTPLLSGRRSKGRSMTGETVQFIASKGTARN